MKIFICNKTIEADAADIVVGSLIESSGYSVAALRETDHSDDWKDKVKKKLEYVDFVVFIQEIVGSGLTFYINFKNS